MKNVSSSLGQAQDVYIHDDMEIMCDGGEDDLETPGSNGSDETPGASGKTLNILGKSCLKHMKLCLWQMFTGEG